MNTLIKVSIYAFPSCIVDGIRDLDATLQSGVYTCKEGWELCTAEKSYKEQDTLYTVKFEGNDIIQFSTSYGFGIGAHAQHTTLSQSSFDALILVIPISLQKRLS